MTDAAFDAAAAAAPSLPSTVSNQEKLQLYALFKQAKSGPAPEKTKASAFDIVAQEKHKAWLALGDLSAADARTRYIALVDRLKGPALSAPETPVSKSPLESLVQCLWCMSREPAAAPPRYVLISTNLLSEMIATEYPDEASALSEAAGYLCCWILFVSNSGIVREVKRGGSGFSFEAIRQHMVKECSADEALAEPMI
jgi:diazepam-binding inhibitor (GABA receptor modulating acyl-CoA-binding protein)